MVESRESVDGGKGGRGYEPTSRSASTFFVSLSALCPSTCFIVVVVVVVVAATPLVAQAFSLEEPTISTLSARLSTSDGLVRPPFVEVASESLWPPTSKGMSSA